MPTCKKCEADFPVRMKIDGKVRNLQRRKYCLDCSPFGSGNTRKLHEGKSYKRNNPGKYRKWQRKARKERKIKLIEMLGGCCCICGYNRCYKALQFHHVNESDKLFGISEMGLCRKWSMLAEEVKKCVCLCSNCHHEVHHGLHEDEVKNWTVS